MSKKNETASTEVVAQVSTAVATSATDLNDWGAGEISQKDLVIPKILVMQGLSDLVGEGKAALGDLVENVSNEKLGSFDKPVEVIPFHMTKAWIVSRRKAGESKFEFEKYEDYKVGQEFPFEVQEGGDTVKYEYNLQFYVLRPEDMSMPYVISFKSTSLRAGKVLSTQMYVRNKASGLAPAAFVMSLSSKREKNDKGTFAVLEVAPKRRTSADEEREALNWYKVIKAGNHQVAAETVDSGMTNSDLAGRF